jgi:hypothetical protein
MAKKTETEDMMEETVKEGAIGTLDANFYRDDLNALRDKLNEVIRAVNNLL